MITLTSKPVLFEYKGKALKATLLIKYGYEELIDVTDTFDFGDKAENAAYLKRFETGELLNLCVTVTALFAGLDGDDHLGACHVKANALEADILELVRDHGMESNAIDELIKNITDLYEALSA